MNDFITEALDLPGIKILDYKITDQAIYIHIESTDPSVPCRVCGKEIKPKGLGQEVKLRHLPILGKPCVTQKPLILIHAKMLAKACHKPCFLRLPSFFIQVLFGQMGKELLLADQKIYPEHLIHLGFKFKYNDISSSLNDILKKF